MNKSLKNQFWIYLSLSIAMVIDTFFFSEYLLHWKPLLTLLALIYWNMALPDKVGIKEALLFGLIMDLLSGSVFGLHGLLFVLITYICQRFFYQFRVSPLLQQSAILFVLFFLFKMSFSFDFYDVAEGMNVSDGFFVINALIFSMTSSLCWTPSYYLLRELRRRKIKL